MSNSLISFDNSGSSRIFSISKQCVYSLEKDLSSLNNEKLVKLLVDYNVNANYLLAGIGEMFISPKDDSYTNMRDSILSDVRKMLKEEGVETGEEE